MSDTVLDYTKHDYQEVEISRAKHYEPKVLQKYKANKANAEIPPQSASINQPVEAIEADVWQLIKQHNNAHDMAKMNRMIRVLFS